METTENNTLEAFFDEDRRWDREAWRVLQEDYSIDENKVDYKATQAKIEKFLDDTSDLDLDTFKDKFGEFCKELAYELGTPFKEAVKQALIDSGNYAPKTMSKIAADEDWYLEFTERFLSIGSGTQTLDFVIKHQNDKLLEEYVDENCGMSVREAIYEAEQTYRSMSEEKLRNSRDFDEACENLKISVQQAALAYCKELAKELNKPKIQKH